MTSKNRLYELDAMRGLAAFAVILYHYTYRFEELYGMTGANSVPFRLTWGDQGVQLFFIISGFVIFMTLGRTKNPLDFVVSRFSRLYPTYWAALLASFVCISLFSLPGREASFFEFLVNLTMLQGFIPNVDHVDGVYWSLTAELAFYLIMIVLYKIKLLSHIESIAILWLMFAVIFQVLSIAETRVGLLIEAIFILKYCNLFIAGILFYQIHIQKISKLTLWILATCLLVSPILNTQNNIYAIIGSFIIFYLFVQGKAAWLKIQPLTFLGSISYALYLLHQNIGYIVIRYFQKNGVSLFFGILAAIFISLLLATCITYLIEKPSIRVIRNIHKAYKDRKIRHKLDISV